ncbi:MAG: hypothetical protein MPJ50_04635 [Pirellulales bacterium]|nr:hypothetical protein [Pirellulales bacterium]
MTTPSFVFATCQAGAESVLKAEFARRWPELRFAYSRPGFVTFKSEAVLPWDHDVPCRESVFARTCGHSLGKIQAETAPDRAVQLWNFLAESASNFDGLHVWARDTRPPSNRRYDPRVPPEAIDAARAIRATAPNHLPPASEEPGEPRPGNESGQSSLRTWVPAGTTVLDVILVEPDVWWIGRHTSTTPPSCWPGGSCRITAREPTISRAFYKLEEALQWSQLPFRKSDRVADLGCAPGGASQALLARGMRVFGVDPADPDPSLRKNPSFWHEKKRGMDVRRKHFVGIPWLVADMNVAPKYTLDCVEEIVKHEGVNIRGMVLTLKFPEWKLASEIPDYVFRVHTWGYKHVQARQLLANGQEITLAAHRE